jgi:hypothetical protein
VKKCIKCGIEKNIEDFHKTGINNNRRKTCKDCRNNWQRANRQYDPERCRGYELKRRYKLTISQFNTILTFQNNSCALCGENKPRGQGTWHVDHDHNCCKGNKSCGKCIRGLLCTNCNSILGFSKDNCIILKKAIQYLKRKPINVKSIAGTVRSATAN